MLHPVCIETPTYSSSDLDQPKFESNCQRKSWSLFIQVNSFIYLWIDVIHRCTRLWRCFGCRLCTWQWERSHPHPSKPNFPVQWLKLPSLPMIGLSLRGSSPVLSPPPPSKKKIMKRQCSRPSSRGWSLNVTNIKEKPQLMAALPVRCLELRNRRKKGWKTRRK